MEELNLKTVEGIGRRRQRMKEAGIALIFASLALLALIVFGPRPEPPAPRESEVATETTNPYEGIALRASSAIVYDLATDRALFEYNANAQLPLASLTKLLTLYAALETLAENSSVLISERALSAEGDNGLHAGDRFSFSDAAALLLVASSNDMAQAIDETVATRRNKTTPEVMMAAAASAGLLQTYAVNGTGLDENDVVAGGYGSARDIALLAGKLLAASPEIALLSTLPEVTVVSEAGTAYTVKNTNEGIARVPNALFSKTGFTDLAGGNLVVVFDAGIHHPIALVVMGSTREGRFADIERLLAATLSGFASASL